MKHFTQVSELLEPTSLFDGEKPEKAKSHYEWFNQYIKFQTKEGNIKDPIKEAIELFEQTLDKKVLIWFQQCKAEFKDLTTMKNVFLARYNPWGRQRKTNYNCGTICPLTHKRLTLMSESIWY